MCHQEWLLLNSAPGPADFNMALDEAVLESLSRVGKPVLRFYGWTERAASFGYFQKYSEVELLTLLRPLVRRPTGGGIVPHSDDWTYSVAIGPQHEWYSVKAVESYQRIHSWVQAAFALMEIKSELAPSAQKTAPGQCFAGFEQFDLLSEARKIAGAAQRRRRDGLLIQGSVQSPIRTLRRTQWEQAMCMAGEQQHHIRWTEWKGDEGLFARAEALRAGKYSRHEYNRRK